MNRTGRDLGGYAGGAGAIAGVCAALCCAGAPILVSILAATGLGFLRSDAILLPMIGAALLVATWGFWNSRQRHHKNGPLGISLVGSILLITGVLLLHGAIAKVTIGVGALLLLLATFWNSQVSGRCDQPVNLRRDYPQFGRQLTAVTAIRFAANT